MTEIKDEALHQVVHYEGLELEIENNPHDRSFSVECSSGAEGEFHDGILRGFDGETPVTDKDILGIENISNHSAAPGTATKLIRFGIEEGRRRGFNRGRSSAFNPRIITIYEKLVAEGLVKERYYFTRKWDEDLKVTPSTEELLKSGEGCTPQEAIEFLQSFRAGPDGGVLDGLVDSIVDF
jgi:hypothetical protein